MTTTPDTEPVSIQHVIASLLMYLVVIQSLVTAVLGARLGWHVIRRTGTFSAPAPTTARR